MIDREAKRNRIKEIGARMEDFSLEFLNLTERNFEG